MDEQTPQPIPAPAPAEPPRRRRTPMKAALIGVGLLAVGGGATALALNAGGPTIEMAPINPVAISGLTDDSLVTLRGRIAEEFGNKAILEDGTGRALLDLGRAGEDTNLIEPGQTVTAQGRFDRGQVRVSFLIDAAGNTRAIGGGGPVPHGKDKWRDGPGRDGPLPPPPGAMPHQAEAPMPMPTVRAAPAAPPAQAAPAPTASDAPANTQGI